MDATAQLCRRCLCQNADQLSISPARVRVQTGSRPSPLSPTAFTISSSRSAASSTEVITNADGTIAQAKSTQRLADVATVSSNQFIIHLYGPTSGPKVNGRYPTNGLTELANWIVLAPDAAQTNYNHLQIIENKSGTPRTNDFTYSVVGLSWTASRPNGLLTERQSSSWDADTNVLTQV